VGQSPLFICSKKRPVYDSKMNGKYSFMAVQLDEIRATAQRVAASHNLELVDLEFQGGVKFRTLRVVIEKNAAERAKLAEQAAAGTSELPKGVPVEMLSGVTHEDCAQFAQDFGTVLDVEDLIPGAEYTLEVSSPGLERKLFRPEDYTRFQGSLVKLQTFTPVNKNRQWQGRLTKFSDGILTIDLSAVKQKGKAKKAATESTVDIALANVEKANLVAEI
jgi:ribosome maturation factor RimP